MVKGRVYKKKARPHVTHSNISGKGVHKKDLSRLDNNPNTPTNSTEAVNPNTGTADAPNFNATTNRCEASNLNTTTNSGEASILNTGTTDAVNLNTTTNSGEASNLNTGTTDAVNLNTTTNNTTTNSGEASNLNTGTTDSVDVPNPNTGTTDAPNLNNITNSVDVPNLTTTSLIEELAEYLNEYQGEQLSSEIPCISIPEREKGGRLKKMDRKVETCTRCDFIAGVFYNGTHDIQTPVVLPYYMERQSEYLLDCTRCKKINRSI